jgi:hypothetical protein
MKNVKLKMKKSEGILCLDLASGVRAWGETPKAFEDEDEDENDWGGVQFIRLNPTESECSIFQTQSRPFTIYDLRADSASDGCW